MIIIGYLVGVLRFVTVQVLRIPGESSKTGARRIAIFDRDYPIFWRLLIAIISGKLTIMNREKHYPRLLRPRNDKSFFLWGPRQVGKSSYLNLHFPDAFVLDLLKSEEQTRYILRPELLRKELEEISEDVFVVIDEVQKVPALLDEVHWLIENTSRRFCLCGSSARKLKRGAANLLGGRALRYEMFGLVAPELGIDFDLHRALNHGYLPQIYLDEQPKELLNSYVSDYLKEEIAEEGLVRNLPPFSDFLRAVAISDTEIVNYTNIASDCGVSKDTARNYYSILQETHLGRFLPALTRRPKRKVIHSPKFYLFDVGVVNFLAKRGRIDPGGELYGKAFENWVFHELSAYIEYSRSNLELSYWRLVNGTEVDFIVDDFLCAIEVKATAKIHGRHLKGLREFNHEHPQTNKLVLVSLEARSRVEEDGILVLSALDFIEKLWQGELFSE